MAFVNLRLGASATWTNADVPLKLNACPTSPGANVVPPCSTPLLLPTLSFALPSPFHQLTRPGAVGVHPGAFDATVSAALELVTPPKPLLTRTEYGPASPGCTLAIV